jgi:hypothetical protein
LITNRRIYLDELELAYQVYAPAQRRKGLATQAVTLLVDYLFDTRPLNRIRLVIHPANVAARRLADRRGFQHESTARGARFHDGRSTSRSMPSCAVTGPRPRCTHPALGMLALGHGSAGSRSIGTPVRSIDGQGQQAYGPGSIGPTDLV